MNFRSGHQDEPELNLIPFIDILLVVLIFLVLTTSYSQLSELQVNLPVADAEQSRQRPHEISVQVGRDNRISVDKVVLERPSVAALSEALAEAAKDDRASVIVIAADASATHQAVVSVMDAARRTGLNQITFSTQSTAEASSAGHRP
jgi:biopolymer transport protein ExbD